MQPDRQRDPTDLAGVAAVTLAEPVLQYIIAPSFVNCAARAVTYKQQQVLYPDQEEHVSTTDGVTV